MQPDVVHEDYDRSLFVPFWRARVNFHKKWGNMSRKRSRPSAWSKSGSIYTDRATGLRYSYKKPSAVAARALAGVRMLMRNTEKKFIFAAETSGSVSSTGSITRLFDIAAGDQEYNRSGLKVNVKGFGFHAQALCNDTGSASILRVIFFVDKRQVADTNPIFSALLQEVLPMSYILGVRKNRFRILYDRIFSMDNDSKKSFVVRFWKKTSFYQKYNGSASTDIERNGIYCALLSNQVTNTPTWRYSALLTFTDS